MTDQAATLRVLRGGKPPVVTKAPASRAIAVSGGKGGVGKSTIAVNLAIAYAQAGSRTLMVDTDLGMADLNLLLGVAPEKSLLDALGGTPIGAPIVGWVANNFGPRWSLGVGAASGFIAALVAICVLARARQRKDGQ